MGCGIDLVYVVLVLWSVRCCGGLEWDQVRCSTDAEDDVPEGSLPAEKIGKFPWIGVIQHDFNVGSKAMFAITSAVLIHPAYALASAADIARIDRRSLSNSTHFILWHSATQKYSFDVVDYTLHPEYETVTLATIALVELMTSGETRPAHPAPVLPICLPVSGAGAYDNLYAVKMTDESGELQKEIFKMDYISNTDCNTFYDKAELSYKKMSPTHQLCAAARESRAACVWDAGAALVTRQDWGFWKLLGFGVRGPGCGAPARYLSIIGYLQWIDERMSTAPFEELADETLPFVLRSVSPIEMYMYLANPTEHQGQCEGRQRGSVMFKDETHLHINKNFAQGFYFVSVARVAAFTCMRLKIESYARSSASLWLEHHCHRDLSGFSGPDHKLHQCFAYFKTTAYLEFRFFFTGNAFLEMTLFGRDNLPPGRVDPWVTVENTLPWRPTDGRLLRWSWFVPVYAWWYDM